MSWYNSATHISLGNLFRGIFCLFIFQASGVLGELMISLGYLRLTERLTIVIIRARNLPQAEEAELDPGKWMILLL